MFLKKIVSGLCYQSEKSRTMSENRELIEKRRRISNLKVTELKEELGKRCLKSKGRKHELVKCLKNALNSSFLSEPYETDVQNNGNKSVKKFKWIHSYEHNLTNLNKKIRSMEIAIKQLQKRDGQLKLTLKNLSKLLEDIQQKDKLDTKNEQIIPQLRNNHNKISLKIPASQNKKVLILGDSHGRDLAITLRTQLADIYDIKCIFKPNALFTEVISDYKRLTQGFNKNDFVILIAGSNDAIKKGYLDKNKVLDTFKNLCNTNVVITTIPYWRNRIVLNNIIHNINRNLSSAAVDGNIFKYLDINAILQQNHFTRHGLHLNKFGKKFLCKKLAGVLQSHIACVEPEKINSKITATERTQQQPENTREVGIYPRLPRSDEELQNNFLGKTIIQNSSTNNLTTM